MFSLKKLGSSELLPFWCLKFPIETGRWKARTKKGYIKEAYGATSRNHSPTELPRVLGISSYRLESLKRPHLCAMSTFYQAVEPFVQQNSVQVTRKVCMLPFTQAVYVGALLNRMPHTIEAGPSCMMKSRSTGATFASSPSLPLSSPDSCRWSDSSCKKVPWPKTTCCYT